MHKEKIIMNILVKNKKINMKKKKSEEKIFYINLKKIFIGCKETTQQKFFLIFFV